jgi:hypothetical protein
MSTLTIILIVGIVVILLSSSVSAFLFMRNKSATPTTTKPPQVTTRPPSNSGSTGGTGSGGTSGGSGGTSGGSGGTSGGSGGTSVTTTIPATNPGELFLGKWTVSNLPDENQIIIQYDSTEDELPATAKSTGNLEFRTGARGNNTLYVRYLGPTQA